MLESGILKELRDAMMCLIDAGIRLGQHNSYAKYRDEIEYMVVSIKVLVHKIEDDWIGP